MNTQRTTIAFGCLLWFVGFLSIASAQPVANQTTPIAQAVSEMRADVDALAEQLESQRLASSEELSGLRAERAELQRQVRLEQIRRDTLAQLFAERTKRVDEHEGRMRTLLSPISRSVEVAKQYVSATLPFKREERLRRLNKIEGDLAVTHPDVGRALTNLWRFVEEEEAIAGEIGLAQQVIELDNRRLLAEVARVGMALMYFRLPTGELGWVVQSEAGWRYELIQAPLLNATVSKIFDDLENNQVLGPKRLVLSTQLPRALDRGLK